MKIGSCGMGVTPYSYYPCAVAGGIDRIFGFNLGRKTLSSDDDMKDLLEHFCSFCGHFKCVSTDEPVTEPVMSPTWHEAYARYSSNGGKTFRKA